MKRPRPILPRICRPGLRLLFVGFNPGAVSAARGHYYANPSNRFYQLLHLCRLTPRKLAPQEDRLLLDWGIGVTDLCPWRAGQPEVLTKQDIARGRSALLARLRRLRPGVIAFNGLSLFEWVTGRKARPGRRPERIGPSIVYALPSPSGRANRLALQRERVWLEMARVVRKLRPMLVVGP